MLKAHSEKSDFQNHNRLLRIAYFSNYFSWVALGIFVLFGIFNVYATFTNDSIRIGATISSLIKQNPSYALELFLAMLRLIIQGVVYWLILKSVSLGLIMIVETNRNSVKITNGDNHGD